MRIWKWHLSVTDIQQVRMPAGAKLLSVQTQNEQPCLWALVDDLAATYEERTFHTYGTGNPLPPLSDYGRFIGTYQLRGGALVFHVFEPAIRALIEKEM